MAADLRLAPCTIKYAKLYVQHHHRHNPNVQGALFALAAESVASGELVGVAMIGRPVSQELQRQGYVEAVRVCTDGTRNACSFLIARARRAAVALGYPPDKFITYTLVDEGGASVRGAGLRVAKCLEARSWAESNVARRRRDSHTIGDRLRWE
jgi:hypothetical protein